VLQIGLYGGLLLLLVRPMGGYMARVFAGERTPLDPLLRPVEKVTYRLVGANARGEQHWSVYATALLVFNFAGALLLYALQRLQGVLPLNPQGVGGMPPALAFNTAVSFATNTNWQAYAGETGVSYLVQAAGLSVQNFLSAATGIAVAVAMTRGLARRSVQTLGNFWVDVTRATLWILLPLSLLLALALVWQGVPQNLQRYTEARTLEGAAQAIAQGPVASQEAIKALGTNGGGFFNANSAHPYENPTPLSNMLEMLAIFVIGAALTNTFGRMVGNERQGWALLAAMLILFLAGVFIVYAGEANGNPALATLGVDNAAGLNQAGGNMEGKEVRFGPAGSALFSVITTAASCGAVNSMHDSFLPLSGGVVLLNILLGEIVVGGVGSGLYGILLFVILTVFIAGLMVGRTPEYLGKKIEAKEVKLTMLAILILPLFILGLTALAGVLPGARASVLNAGPHGFSELLYAFSSGAGNNGSAFAGLNANTSFFNIAIGFGMIVGRFMTIVPALAIAGSLAGKKSVPVSAGTFTTTGPLFVALLIGVIMIVGGLTFFPALSLGPIVEHLLMLAGKTF
jgi:K+-transporting ATPase ATPase A chain